MIFKTRSNIINFWSIVEGLPEIEPISLGREYLPDWFKTLRRFTNFDNPTVKNCPSFVDFHRQGYVMKMWCDSILTLDGWETSSDQYRWSYHDSGQFIEHLPKHKQLEYKKVYKTVCPWYVKTPKNISMIQMPMFYDYNPEFEVLPGIVDTDFHHELNQQVVIKKDKVLIKKGTPLCMYIPIRREEFKMSQSDETPELEKIRKKSKLNMFSRFTDSYRQKQKDMMKSGDYKCPHHK